MTTAALSAGLLWLGFRVVTLVLGHLVQFNLGPWSVGSVAVKRRVTIPTGCGCAAWCDLEGG